jgi:hypothetical protein
VPIVTDETKRLAAAEIANPIGAYDKITADGSARGGANYYQDPKNRRIPHDNHLGSMNFHPVTNASKATP